MLRPHFPEATAAAVLPHRYYPWTSATGSRALIVALTLILGGALSTPTGLEAQDWIRAATTGRVDLIQTYLEEGVPGLDTPDEAGYTPIRWAGIRNHGDVVLLLAHAGADPNSVGADGGTPLHGAAHHDDPAMVAALLEAGADVAVQNQWGRTPLHVAARRGCVEVARLLLQAGADPNATTAEGWSTLNVAYRGGHPELVELLLEAGADPELADTEGLLPGAVRLVRPEGTPLSRRQLDEYVGHYDLGEGNGFDVWRAGDDMHLMEFAPDGMVPVAVDTFLAVREPWKVVFLRDAEGTVAGMDVEFLRRKVSARKVVDTSAGYTYVGSQACFACHALGPGNGPAGEWIASRHSRAFHTLSTDQARALAAGKDDYQDITNPAAEDRCVMCHRTAAQNPHAVFGETYAPGQGVGCEACHGPGSAYMDPSIMADREAFLANGGRIPDELTCRTCHRNPEFDFMTMWERIRHGE